MNNAVESFKHHPSQCHDPKRGRRACCSFTPSECCALVRDHRPGVLATLVPPVTESGRFQRPFPRLLKVHTFGVLPHENDHCLVIW